MAQAQAHRDIDPLHRLILQPTFDDLAAVVNRVQRHACTAYCQRAVVDQQGNRTADTRCRFHFPRQTHPQPKLVYDWNPNYPVFDGARNDGRLNHYNRTISMAWLSNTDISPCTSAAAVVNYIVKYVGKAVKKTETFQQVAAQAMARVNSNRGLTGFVAKFMNRLIAERDWTAQEVQNILLALDLSKSTRIVQSVDCRHPSQHWKADTITDGGTNLRAARNTYQKYLGRPDHLEQLSYFQFLSRVDFSGQMQHWRERPQAPNRVLGYFPIYVQSQEPENYFRVKLMLHHTHRSFDELLTVEDQTFESYAEAYMHCLNVHAGAHEDDYYRSFRELEHPEPDENEEDIDEDGDDNIQQEAW